MHTLLRILAFILIAITVIPSNLYAHGEEAPGPHGGFLSMPATFHVEVVPQKKGLVILLLDISFEHPTVKDSSMTAAIKSDKHTTTLKCETQSDHYFCPIDSTKLLKAGTLEIDATRKKVKGAVARYALPLQWHKS